LNFADGSTQRAREKWGGVGVYQQKKRTLELCERIDATCTRKMGRGSSSDESRNHIEIRAKNNHIEASSLAARGNTLQTKCRPPCTNRLMNRGIVLLTNRGNTLQTKSKSVQSESLQHAHSQR